MQDADKFGDVLRPGNRHLAVDEEIRHAADAQLRRAAFVGAYRVGIQVACQHFVDSCRFQPGFLRQHAQHRRVADFLPFAEVGAQEAVFDHTAKPDAFAEVQQTVRVEGIARFSVAPAKFQAVRPCRRFFVRQHAKRVVFVHAVEGVQDAGQRHAVAGRRVRIELEAVPFDVGVDAGLRECQFQFAFADGAERADNVRPDVDFHGFSFCLATRWGRCAQSKAASEGGGQAPMQPRSAP